MEIKEEKRTIDLVERFPYDGVFDIVVDNNIIAFISFPTNRIVASRFNAEEVGLELNVGEVFSKTKPVQKGDRQ